MSDLEVKDMVVRELCEICRLSGNCILPTKDSPEMSEMQEKYFRFLAGDEVMIDDLLPNGSEYDYVTICTVLYKDSEDNDMVKIIIIHNGYMEADFTDGEWAVVLRNLNGIAQYKMYKDDKNK